VVERSTCNYSCPMWKLAFHVMVTKVSRITSWVLMISLPWAQHKRWLPIRSMGCVHTHRRMPTIKGWGSPSHVRNAMQKTKENNWKVRKTSRTISQMPTPRPKHDKIQARWALDVSLKSMLERVRWCKHFEMESWRFNHLLSNELFKWRKTRLN